MGYRGHTYWLEIDSVKHAFKPHNGKYPAVLGGRWFVRRWEDSNTRKDGRVWHAWTTGQGKKFNRRFSTQVEAIDWAVRVANAYKIRNFLELEVLYSEKYPTKKDAWIRSVYVSGSVAQAS